MPTARRLNMDRRHTKSAFHFVNQGGAVVIAINDR
jgi:hypothetical protein